MTGFDVVSMGQMPFLTPTVRKAHWASPFLHPLHLLTEKGHHSHLHLLSDAKPPKFSTIVNVNILIMYNIAIM